MKKIVKVEQAVVVFVSAVLVVAQLSKKLFRLTSHVLRLQAER